MPRLKRKSTYQRLAEDKERKRMLKAGQNTVKIQNFCSQHVQKKKTYQKDHHGTNGNLSLQTTATVTPTAEKHPCIGDIISNYYTEHLSSVDTNVIWGHGDLPVEILDLWSCLLGIIPPSIIYQASCSCDCKFAFPEDVTVTQIHYIDNHYVVSHQYHGTITVYDSLYSSTRLQRLTPQLHILYQGMWNGNLCLMYKTPQHQGPTNDCGFFAAANAYNLQLGKDIMKIRLIQSELRSHLCICITAKTMSQFPSIYDNNSDTTTPSKLPEMQISSMDTTTSKLRSFPSTLQRYFQFQDTQKQLQKIKINETETNAYRNSHQDKHAEKLSRFETVAQAHRKENHLRKQRERKQRDRELDRQRKQAKRMSRPETEVLTDRQHDRLRKQTERRSKSEEAAVKERSQNRKSKQAKRMSRPEAEVLTDRQHGRLRKQTERRSKSEEAAVKERSQNRKSQQGVRKSRLEAEVLTDRQHDRLRKQTERRSKSEEAAVKEREQNRQRKLGKRRSRSQMRTHTIKAHDRRRKEAFRKSRSEIDNQQDRYKDKLRQKETRAKLQYSKQKLFEQSASSNEISYMSPGVVSVISSYEKAIQSGPIYICTCCCRSMFKASVVHFNISNYPKLSLSLRSMCTLNMTSAKSSQWICKTCHKVLKRCKLPSQAIANNLSLQNIPAELKNLTTLEVHLVCRIIPFMKIVSKPRGAQHGIHGQVVLVPSDMNKVADVLPRVASESQIILLALKRRLSDQHSVHRQFIRPVAVMNALRYLKEHNHAYFDIHIDEIWMQNPSNRDKDFWNEFTEHQEHPKHQDNPSNASAETITDSEDEVEKDIPTEMQQHLSQSRSINVRTCLQPQEGHTIQTSDVINIAPGEGVKPVSTFKQPEWEALAFPHLFPSAENTFNVKRDVKLTPKKYINARLLHVDGRFGESTEYIFQSLHWLETLQLQSTISISQRKSPENALNVKHLKNSSSISHLLKTNQLFTTFKSLRGTPMYWQQMQLDMLAKLRQLGPYTFFLTASAAEFQWTEVISVVAQQYGEHYTKEQIEAMDWNTKRNWLQRNPVTAARQIDYIFQQIWGQVILSGAHPIGEIINYDRRKEMQGRGTEHFHAAIHVKGAPCIDKDSDEKVIKFIDSYVFCHIPDRHSDPVLHDLVTSRQIHHHKRTCKKKKDHPCRFFYPRPPTDQTLIARPNETNDDPKLKQKAKENLQQIYLALTNMDPNHPIKLDDLLQQCGIDKVTYRQNLQISQKRINVVMKRSTEEVCVNNYNPILLRALKSNMDIQFITNIWACIAYLTSYMCKPERNMSELMKKASKEASDKPVREQLQHIGNVFLKAREVSEHEAVARILSLPMRKSNLEVKFIPTDFKENRTRMLKPLSVIQTMKDHEENIYVPSILDKYAARPNSLEDKCLAFFIANYTNKVSREEEEESEVDNVLTSSVITLQNNMGKMVKRKRQCIIRYHNVSKLKDAEQYYHRLLLLYYPWRTEDELLLKGSYELKYQVVKSTILPSIKSFENYFDDVEEVLENFDPLETETEIWGQIASEMEQDRENAENTQMDVNYSFIDPEHLPPEPPITKSYRRKSKSTFSLDITTSALPDDDYYDLVNSLNAEQKCVFDFIHEWATNTHLSAYTQSAPKPFCLFLSGGAGVGKSHTLSAVYQCVSRALRDPKKDPEKPTVLITATTGKAAANIDGTTVHSAFSLPIRDKSHNSSQSKTSAERLNTQRMFYQHLKLIIIDEISMLGSKSLLELSRKLQEIFEKPDVPFGGLSLLAVGDLLQLNPVGDRPVFANIRTGYEVFCTKSLWSQHFQLHELTEIVRQRSDPNFAQILSRMRVGMLSPEDLESLDQLQHTDTSTFPSNPMHLFLTNAQAQEMNEKKLEELKQPIITVTASNSKKDLYTQSSHVTVTSQNIHDTGGLTQQLSICVGCRWMHTKNIDIADKLVNGATGTVVSYDINPERPLDGTIYVRFDNPKCGIRARKESPPNLSDSVPVKAVIARFQLSRNVQIPVERKQYPGILAFALTVHKSQGSTYPYVIGDLSRRSQKTPIPQGLTYTMLSRCPSRSSLKLVNFSPSKITVNEAARNEMERMKSEALFSWENPLNAASQPLKIGHLNIRSLPRHFVDLVAHTSLQSLTVLCLTETHARTDANNSHYTLPGYHFLLRNSEHGLAILIKDSIESFDQLASLYINTQLEYLAVLIHSEHQSIIVAALYRPPSQPKNIFLSSLKELLDFLPTSKYPTVICGDFNLDHHFEQQNLLKLMSTYGMKQLINSPTHALGGILDVIYTNYNSDNVCSHTFPVVYTDHHLVWAGFDL